MKEDNSNNITSPDIANIQDIAKRYKYQLIISVDIIAVVVLAIISILNFLDGSIVAATFEFIVTALYIILLLYTFITKKISWTGILSAVLIIIVNGYVLISGGVYGNSAYWMFVIPVLIFALLGRGIGSYLSVGFILFMVIAAIADVLDIYQIYLGYSEVFMLIAAYTVVTLFAYINQTFQDNAGKLIQKKDIQLKNNISDLRESIARAKEADRQMREKSKELERLNQFMVGRELKMIELKKEINKNKSSKHNIKRK